MKKIFAGSLVLGIVCAFGSNLPAADDSAGIECLKSADFLASADGGSPLNYAPDRDVTVLHLALDVTPDFKQRTVAGTATLQFKPNLKPARELKLDAVDLQVQSVTGTVKIATYQVTKDHLIITFAEPVPADQTASVTVTYDAEPDLGLYFRTPEMGYKEGDTHCFSQGEEIEARHWYPCFDSPNEKFTSEVTCHVPDGMTVISNGRLLGQTPDGTNGLVAFHWTQELPHANYLITLVAGYFKSVESRHKEVPLAFLTPPSEFAEATNSFRETEAIMDFYEQEIGVPFPWAKYDQTCVNDFVAGGMENTSATTLTDRTLATADTENIRDSQGLVAHEMAHQWFGDLVTCKDWSHIWLNEGFATYYQVLYHGYKNGRDAMLFDLYGNAHGVTGMPNDTNSIVRRNYHDPFEMFGYLAYPKGSWVLHMLRSELGADLYRRCIKTYLERHRYGNVTTEDLRAVIEELSGKSYDQFFDQWLYHAHYPELDIAYSWDESSKLAKVSIKQTQELSERVMLFHVPLTVRFKGKFGTVDREVQVKAAAEDFYFPLEAAPTTVRIDPEYTLLAKTSFAVPNDMLYEQLADQSDMIGRLLAVEQLADHHDKKAVAQLKQTLNEDSFYGVRVAAAKALRTIHTDEALTALLDSAKQADARVRLAVVTEAGGFYQAPAGDFLRETLAHEKNPAVAAEAIQGLAAFGQPEIHELLLKYLKSDSYHQELAGAAIVAMQAQDDPAYVAPLLQALSERQADLPTRVFAQGLGALAYLDRNEEKKDDVREFLIGHVNDKRKFAQRSAITALGTLGDPRAIALLNTFATAAKDSPEHTAAESAVAALRADRKPVDDFKNLRTEVTDLEKANRNLRQDLDDLKKRLDAQDGKTGKPDKKHKSS